MAELLSQNELDKLLGIAEVSNKQNTVNKEQNYMVYDFKKQNRLPSFIFENLNTIQNQIVSNLTTKLSILFRKLVDIKSYSIEQMSFGEFILSTPSITYIHETNLNNTPIYFETNPKISKKIIQVLTGASTPSSQEKEATKLELSIFNIFQDLVKNEMKDTLSSFGTTTIDNGNFYTNTNHLQYVSNHKSIVSLVFKLTIDEEEGFISICLPIDSLSVYIDKWKDMSNPKKETSGSIKEFSYTDYVGDISYKILSLLLKNKDVIQNNELDLSSIDIDNFKEFNLPQLDFSLDNEIRNDISLKTKSTFIEFEENEINLDCINLKHPIEEKLEVWVNDQIIGDGEFSTTDSHSAIKFDSYKQSKAEVLNNLKNKFNLILHNDSLLLAQDNRVLFILEQTKNEKVYILKKNS